MKYTEHGVLLQHQLNEIIGNIDKNDLSGIERETKRLALLCEILTTMVQCDKGWKKIVDEKGKEDDE